MKQNDRAEAILQRGIEFFPEAQELQKAFAELNDIRTAIAASSTGR
jgi:hypothetical protein